MTATNKTYDQHDAAFRDVSAWVICKGGERVATVAIKYTGRRSPNGLTVRAYVHIIGLPMVRGTARGGGYDMKSAAVLDAIGKIKGGVMDVPDHARPTFTVLKELTDSGTYWYDQLSKPVYDDGSRFEAFQAV